MARGKSTFCTWYCGDCNKAGYTTTYNKRSQEEAMKTKNKYCSTCRKHIEHKRKDTKS
ncbi:MAG: 50S ribosomal protein L33 [Patescibacteria group bacterium]|nr:50S ribosomal protein L33 [Patescibacteria group bacterium]